jgi:hypothetical protein
MVINIGIAGFILTIVVLILIIDHLMHKLWLIRKAGKATRSLPTYPHVPTLVRREKYEGDIYHRE